MWKILLPEVKEVHLDFWFACACFNAFSMRERAREWGMRIILQVWKSPAFVAVVSGFHAYIGGDARCWGEGWRLRDEHACLSALLSSRRRRVQSSQPVWADLRPSAWTSMSLSTPKELLSLSARMSDNLGQSVPLESVAIGRLHITIPNLPSPITHCMLTFGKVSVISKHTVSLLCVQMWVWSHSPLGWRRIWGSEIWFLLTKKKKLKLSYLNGFAITRFPGWI